MSDVSLALKVSKASLDVGGKLSADKTNKEQNYDYLSADKILSVCGQALAGQGVVVLPEIEAQETHLFEYTDAYGKAKKRYDSRVDYTFRITDGITEITQKWYGMGSDYTVPDKALYKAITSGHKYFLMKLLCVGAGNEDGEHEEEEPKKPAQQPKQVQPAQQPAAKKPEPQPAPAASLLEEAEKAAGTKAVVTSVIQVPPMSYEEAAKFVDRNGNLYTGLLDKLPYMQKELEKGLLEHTYSAEAAEIAQQKLAAILAIRNH